MTVRFCKVTISLPGDLLEYADRRARRTRLSRSQVISEALAEAQAQEQAHLAAEGYRFYAGEANDFAEASAAIIGEALGASPSEGDADGREAW